jgi:hypothetical protein
MTKEILEQVRGLHLPLGAYALFGSGPLGVRGLREMHDADIIVHRELFDALRLSPDWTYECKANGSESLHYGDIEMFDTWAPGEWNVIQLIAEAEMREGLPFVKLEEVKRWKNLRFSDKDKKDLELIAAYEKSPQS